MNRTGDSEFSLFTLDETVLLRNKNTVVFSNLSFRKRGFSWITNISDSATRLPEILQKEYEIYS